MSEDDLPNNVIRLKLRTITLADCSSAPEKGTEAQASAHSARLARISASLQRIDGLMAELKHLQRKGKRDDIAH